MAKKKDEIAKTNVELPDYIKTDKNRGSENVEMEDIVIPRIELLQDLSPAIKKNKPEYIEDAKPGMMCNSVTRKLYDGVVKFVPVMFKKDYIIWKSRKSGGGFRGAFESEQEAASRLEIVKQEENGEFEIAPTAQHIVLIVNDDSTEEAVISMSKSKMKVSRNFNSMVRINGGDRFSRRYALSAIEDSSDQGDFWNFKIKNDGFPSKEAYLQAEKLYEDISSGVLKASVDTNYDSTDESEDNIPF